MAGPAPAAEAAKPEPTKDEGDDDEAQAAAAQSAADEEPTPTTDEPKNPEDKDSEADGEVVEDAATGKKLIGIKHFNRMHRQRDEAKASERAAKAEADAAKAEAADLKAKLAEVEDKPVVMAADNDPLFNATTTEQVEATEANAKAWRMWCLRNLQGGTPPVQGAEEMDADQVVSMLEWAEKVIESVPTKKAFLANFTKTRTEVRKEMPQMFTPGTEEHGQFQALQRKLLNFRTAADQDAIIAKLIKYEAREREEREGIARYPRVELKPGKQGEGKALTKVTTMKPSPKPAATAPVIPAVRAATGSNPKEAARARLDADAPVDVEELIAAGVS